METALKTVSIIAIIIGALAIVGGEGDYYAFIGGAFFATQGILSLVYISKTKNR